MKSNQPIDIEMIFRIKIPFSGAFQFEREKFVMNGSGAVALYVEEWGEHLNQADWLPGLVEQLFLNQEK